MEISWREHSRNEVLRWILARVNLCTEGLNPETDRLAVDALAIAASEARRGNREVAKKIEAAVDAAILRRHVQYPDESE